MNSQPTLSRYTGDFVAWRGGCGFLGCGGRGTIDTHSHYAIQLAIGAPSGLKVQFGRQGTLTACAGALIPSAAPHTIDVNDCEWTAVLFVEPETTEGKALTRMLEGKARYLPLETVLAPARRLEQAWRIEKDAEKVKAVCLQLVQELAQASAREPTDPRVLAAIQVIHDRVDQKLTLEQLAALANLSPSRFRHLFVAETGMPLRTYLLWRRLLHVWTLLMQGETLSSAAHASGFADSAHLSRTARTMFGLPPSAMQMTGPLSTRLRVPQHYLG
ncbi:AraC family transcriptional regulator [Ramlibacter sp. AN1015]|uniref:AraC family transcriptional regulator n=1 Tax=Ramlibacter sp. AN1015 TaxID=3133428 RepID=UPI0030C2BCD2